MNKLIIVILAFCLFAVGGEARAGPTLETMTLIESHELFIYPVVRVTATRSGGSGTVIYSKPACEKTFSTYVLTNHHVISDAISIREEWDSSLQKMVKREKRDLVYVEVFQYRDISTPIGTLKVEAEIVIYNKDEDMAILKLRSESQVLHVARMRTHDNADSFHVLDKSLAVGCSLLFPPLPTSGIITRKSFNVNSYPFHMSSSQIIYGNSGGAMFHLTQGDLIGIPSLVPVIGWGTPITHMGLFIPIKRVYDWLEKEHYHFLFDPSKSEKECLEARAEVIAAKTKAEERR